MITISLPPVLRVHDQLLLEWIANRDSWGAQYAEADAAQRERARRAWQREFAVSRVLLKAAQIAGREGYTSCLCSGWGYLPAWAVEAMQAGLRPQTYADPWGWTACRCALCQPGDKIDFAPDGLPTGVTCGLCAESGLVPDWVTALLGGSPTALDRLMTVTGWLPAPCRACGGWGRLRPEPVATEPDGTSAVDSAPASTLAGAITEVAPAKLDTATTFPTAALQRDGEIWEASFGARSVRLADRLGLRYLAYLLERPGRAVPVLNFLALRGGPIVVPALGQMATEGLVVSNLADIGELIDKKAKKQYKARLDDLSCEITEAENNNDLGRLQRLRREQDDLHRTLVAVVAKRGRQEAPELRRARDSVSKAILEAIQEIRWVYPGLADHLTAFIKFGSQPVYDPR